jgi:hypothetical protein
MSPLFNPPDGGLALFGSGEDGDVTIAVNTNLSADMHYNNLTINGGGIILTPSGWRIYVRGTLLVLAGGAIFADGNDAVGAAGGAQLFRGSISSQALAGGNGGVGAGVAGGGTANVGMGGDGGAGGAGGAGAGGAGGNNTFNQTLYGSQATFHQFIRGNALASNAVGRATSGAGGGGGGGDGVNSGGGGGGGGEPMIIFARRIVNLGTISANGGAGANGVAGDSGGGGGGGGGRIHMIANQYSGAIPTASGGAFGAGVGTGVDGTVGADGTMLIIENSDMF